MNKLLSRVCGVVILIAVLFISSCDKDNDPNPADLIVGKWSVVGGEAKITPSKIALIAYLKDVGFTEDQANSLLAELETSAHDVTTTGTIEFKADGTYESVDGTDVDTGKWELSGDGKTLTTDKGTTNESIAAITTLDGSSLVIEFNLSKEIGLPTSSGIGYLAVLTLKKV